MNHPRPFGAAQQAHALPTEAAGCRGPLRPRVGSHDRARQRAERRGGGTLRLRHRWQRIQDAFDSQRHPDHPGGADQHLLGTAAELARHN